MLIIPVLTPLGAREGIHPGTVISLLRLHTTSLFKAAWKTEPGPDVSVNRNTLLADVIDNAESCRFALFLDSDNTTTAEGVMHALQVQEETQAAVVGGLYRLRTGMLSFQPDKYVTGTLEDVKIRKPVKVPRVGGGVMLLDLDWFRTHWPTAPWFRFEYVDWKGHRLHVGEDYYFCDCVIERRGIVAIDTMWISGHAVPNGTEQDLKKDLDL